MWVGLRKGLPRSVSGKFSLVGDDCGVGHKGDGAVDTHKAIHERDDKRRSGLPQEEDIPPTASLGRLPLESA